MNEVMSEVQQFFYYTGKTKEIQTKNGPDAMFKRKATVAFLVNPETGDWSRGVAVCSDRDNFDKKRGRDIAMGRAVKAMTQEKSCAQNKMRESIFKDSMLPAPVDNKCAFKTIPTDYEAKLIRQAIAAHENLACNQAA